MAEQRLHSGLAPIDVLTREELEEVQTRQVDAIIRDRYRGVESQRFPRTIIEASATTQNLAPSANEAPTGPEQGDIWIIRRVIVKSSLFTDTAKYILFKGATPSDPNAYGILQLLEAFAAAGAGQPVGVGYYPSSRSIMLQPGEQIYAQVLTATVGNQYMLDGEAIRCPAEMKGKLLS